MERVVNCINSRALIEYVKRHFPDLVGTLLDDLDPFFNSIENVEQYLCDENNWISQHVCAKMFERVRLYSEDGEVARKIGNESITHRRFGYIENIFIKVFGHPYLTILKAPSINAKFNKTKTVEVVESGWTHAIIRLKWFNNMGSTKDICLYNQGVYEAIPTIWGLPMAKTIKHKCYFEGEEFCEFHFQWVKKSLLSLILGLFSRHREVLNASLVELERQKSLLEKKYREIENLNIELKEKFERLSSLDACSKATSSILDANRLLDVVMSLVTNIMKFDRALIMMVDEKRKNLIFVRATGGTVDNVDRLEGYNIPLSHTSNILARVVDTGIAQVVRDVDHSYLRKENIILQSYHPKAFVVAPLISRNKVIGVMAAERIKGLDNFTSNDLDYVMNFCNQIAISLENAGLIENMKKSFVSSILSLSSALEAKDAYTRGHSNRVATYCTIIASHMGMDESQVELIRLMALMHDVGKIGISDSLINKQGKLTPAELRVIQRHPLVSLQIIEPLLTNNPDIRHVKSHHERYDGLGYPDGLAGDDIPLEARIMAVADAFDAMTTDRAYRHAMTKKEALAEIIHNSGTQFSPEIVEVFRRVISSLPGEVLYKMINTPPKERMIID